MKEIKLLSLAIDEENTIYDSSTFLYEGDILYHFASGNIYKQGKQSDILIKSDKFYSILWNILIKL